jgi:hypothetical protein
MAGNPLAMLTKPRATLASADFASRRIERVFDRETREVSIRFSVWAGGKINMRPLAMPEDELLVLIGEPMAAKVFSPAFLGELQAILRAQGTG